MSAPAIKVPEVLAPGDAARLVGEVRSAWKRGREVRLDGSALSRMDSLGQAFFSTLRDEAARGGHKLAFDGFNPEMQQAFDDLPPRDDEAGKQPPPPGMFESVGKSAYSLVSEWKDIALLLSESLYHTTLGLRRKKTMLRGETSTQMIRLGSTALPIVLLLSSLIGFTLALQSGLQLAKYGAAIFLADGIGISMITEIGPLMTAVILAGRSGSAITAELATMTVQEEVSALRSMSINPLHFLVLPRFWALSVTQPLLTVASALSGIFAGMLVALLFFNISPSAFLNQLQSALTLTYVWQMAVKSLTFAWLIVLIASVKGLSVRGGADAVGRATTACVVNCIFAIVLGDALFSFVFYL